MEDFEGDRNQFVEMCIVPGKIHLERFFIVVNIFLAITASLGNTVILAALSKASSVHPPSKMLLRSLALTDLCVGLFSEPLVVVIFMTREYEILDLCGLLATIGYVTSLALFSVSLFTVTAINVDRLLALLLGLKYRQVVTFKRVVMIVICFWICSIGFSVVYFWNYDFTSYYAFVINGLCLIGSSYCFINIYQKLRNQQAQIQEHDHQGQPNREEPLNIARYKKTVCCAVWVQLTVVICYLPLAISTALLAVTEWTSSLFLAFSFSVTLVYLNSTLNPILYCWKMREVRRAAIDIIRPKLFCLPV